MPWQLAHQDGWYHHIHRTKSFAFDAEIDCDLGHDKQFITMGAEQQLFLLEINECSGNRTDFKLDLLPRFKPAIYCISDCFVEEDVWEHVVFASVDRKSVV